MKVTVNAVLSLSELYSLHLWWWVFQMC